MTEKTTTQSGSEDILNLIVSVMKNNTMLLNDLANLREENKRLREQWIARPLDNSLFLQSLLQHAEDENEKLREENRELRNEEPHPTTNTVNSLHMALAKSRRANQELRDENKELHATIKEL